MDKNSQPIRRRYARRGATERVTISIVVPARVATYLRKTAKRTGDSISLVATDLLEESIFGPEESTKSA